MFSGRKWQLWLSVGIRTLKSEASWKLAQEWNIKNENALLVLWRVLTRGKGDRTSPVLLKNKTYNKQIH